MFSFRVDGVDRLKKSLGKLAQMDKTIIGPEMRKWATATTKKLTKKPYPPRLPNQRYKRTGRLGRSWKTEHPKPSRAIISNTANFKGKFYAVYVVGQNQADIHKGRWWIAKDFVADELPELTKNLSGQVVKIWQNG